MGCRSVIQVPPSSEPIREHNVIERTREREPTREVYVINPTPRLTKLCDVNKKKNVSETRSKRVPTRSVLKMAIKVTRRQTEATESEKMVAKVTCEVAT